MSSQTRSSQESSAKGMGRQAVGRVFALTLIKPEDDALLVEGMILVYSTWVVTLTLEENKVVQQNIWSETSLLTLLENKRFNKSYGAK